MLVLLRARRAQCGGVAAAVVPRGIDQVLNLARQEAVATWTGPREFGAGVMAAVERG